MSRELIAVIDQIGREKGIDKAKVIGAVEAALQTAAKKRFGQSENIQVQIDQKTGEISVVSLKTIVDTVTNPKDVQVVLSRTHPHFVAKLFELEVPEVSEKIVEIKGIVREPGDRTKIAVASRDKAVDPVGACVGIKGSRVQAVVRELRGEKIDIIAWTTDARVFIAEALNPASIDKGGIDEEKKAARAVVDESQLAMARA